LVVAAALCVVLLLWVELWPFQQKPVVQNLKEASDSKLRLRAFRRTYFPFPGCVLEGLEFNQGSNTSKPLITMEKLIIRGSYFGIFSRRLTRITAKNMHVFIPASVAAQPFTRHLRKSPLMRSWPTARYIGFVAGNRVPVVGRAPLPSALDKLRY
jgi:hypothetical protein